MGYETPAADAALRNVRLNHASPARAPAEPRDTAEMLSTAQRMLETTRRAFAADGRPACD